jgi:hypothetical protein
MLIRTVLVSFGIIEMLLPKRVAEYAMDVSTEGDPEYEFKPWVYTLARLEGLVIVILALRWGRNSTDTESS